VRSVTVLDRKFERVGNRFVVFHVDATDADGERIAEYDYTCLWERGSAGTPRSSNRSASATVKDVRPRTGTVLIKSETAETIAAYGKLAVGRPDDWLSTHTNEEFARTAIFGGAVNAGVATVVYTAQWLDLVERPGILWNGGRFESRALAPVKAGDDLHITGERREGEADLVYEIVAVNQSGVTTFRSVATIPGG
jgi:acyl dehydratase